jgi:hypothetical protein
MPSRAVILLSGGLDSMLAVRILQEQGIEVEALNFQTPFTCCQNQSAQAAHELGVRLTVITADEAYLDLIRQPAHGYGRGANPCVDCRIYMFRGAARFMHEVGAEFVASGEVVGQRPMSQKKRDLAVIACHSGLEDRLLRPLSAKLLPPTAAERQGLVDRSRLYDFCGRSRKGLIALAREFGFRRIPHPSTGCALTEASMATKVFDLLESQPDNRRWDFDLLKVGRHVRIDNRTKVVLGRREAENVQLKQLHRRQDAREAMLLEPENFQGPTALVVGATDETVIDVAGSLILRHVTHRECRMPRVWLDFGRARTLRGIEQSRRTELVPLKR